MIKKGDCQSAVAVFNGREQAAELAILSTTTSFPSLWIVWFSHHFPQGCNFPLGNGEELRYKALTASDRT
ncbi:hypothetical protein PYR71_16325 [Rhizobium sp. MC63]|uniref:Uncharacterized protein n=1 Tax=Rhizobium mulingense TaxID=3031128 RepID=A0ACC6MXI1_9HYPH|nr:MULTISPECIES: hypothetical protein [unclassified Rhizobium]MDF0698038.1 hypothetical protein [Rhizobium sp. MC63]MEA3518095.1 hypothetical protein [Rhizobium sp. MJ31]MEB3043553.1 hypothetical protein [Rhizobium sp. MJ21]